MEIALGLAIIVIVLGLTIGRMLLKRDGGEGKRKKKLDEIRANEPEHHTPTIEELVAQEMAETGVDRVAGGEDLPAPIKLKVFRRDSPALGDFEPSDLRFVVAAGVSPPEATIEDVRLTRVETAPGEQAVTAAAEGDDADGDPAGEHSNDEDESANTAS